MREWLIRHANHTFSRPTPEDEIIRQIEAGEITPEDELCPASGYWFTIQEVEEVQKHFGEIHLKAMIPGESEITSATNTAPVADLKTPVPSVKTKYRPAGVAVAKPRARMSRPEVDLGSTDESAVRRARLMGLFLSLIFFGTLGLLWLGSR